MEGFKYIIRKQEEQKICFGSGCKRDDIRKEMNTFMRYHSSDSYPNVSPASYNVLDSFNAASKKPCSHSFSTKGYSGIARFASRIQRVEDYPSPFDYNVPTFPRPVIKARYPFNAASKRRTLLASDNNNPGPATYAAAKIQGITFEHSFGGRKKMQLGVKLKCCNYNVDTCKICGERPIGDYWEYNNKNYLCRPCKMQSLRRRSSKRTDPILFHKVRDCRKIHLHEGTDTKAWIVHPKDAIRWMRIEAYLSAYLKD